MITGEMHINIQCYWADLPIHFLLHSWHSSSRENHSIVQATLVIWMMTSCKQRYDWQIRHKPCRVMPQNQVRHWMHVEQAHCICDGLPVMRQHMFWDPINTCISIFEWSNHYKYTYNSFWLIDTFNSSQTSLANMWFKSYAQWIQSFRNTCQQGIHPM